MDADHVRGEDHVHAEQLGKAAHVFLVLVALIAGLVRDHQTGFDAHPLDQLDGMLDALAPHDPRRLQEKSLVGGDAQVGAQGGGVFVRPGGRAIEIHHVGDDGGSHALAAGDLVGGQRVDDHVPDGRQARREGHVQEIVDTVDQEALALPGKIVVVADGRQAGLGDQLGQRKPQGDVHRDGQRILDDQQLDAELLDEFVQVLLEVPLQLTDAARHRKRPHPQAKGQVMDLADLGVIEIRLGHHVTHLCRSIADACKVEDLVSQLLQDVRPFVGFQGDAVVGAEAGGDEANSPGRDGRGKHVHSFVSTSHRV